MIQKIALDACAMGNAVSVMATLPSSQDWQSLLLCPWFFDCLSLHASVMNWSSVNDANRLAKRIINKVINVVCGQIHLDLNS